MNFKNPAIEKFYEYLSRKSRGAYSDPLLISNVVLNKQETRGRVFETYIGDEAPLEVSFFFAVKKIILYFVKNLTGLILCLVTALLHRLSGQKFCVKEGADYVFLDAFFGTNHILKKGEFEDIYFPGLYEYLSIRQIEYAYVPKWFGSSHPLQLFRIFRILKKSHIPVLTQFQVLKLVDYFDTAQFIFLYPFSIFRFAKTLGSSYEDRVLYGGLWNALDGVAFDSHMRYLFARRLAALKLGRVKCISWYENLVADKNFYRGLRTFPGKTEIIGAQLFLRSWSLMNLFPDENEIPFNVVPDKILVTGPGCLFKLGQVEVGVGPALRYKHLFNVDPLVSTGEIILVVLPYWDHVARDILRIVHEIEWPRPVKIKFHPVMDCRKYESMIPQKFSVTTESLNQLLSQALMVVGNSTGAMIEAASLGIPVIKVKNPNSFSHGYMPEIGKGIIWDQAEDKEEINMLVREFQKHLEDNPELLKKEGVRLRSFCFGEPTDELIGRAFELE